MYEFANTRMPVILKPNVASNGHDTGKVVELVLVENIPEQRWSLVWMCTFTNAGVI